MYVKLIREYIGEEMLEYDVATLPENWDSLFIDDKMMWLEDNALGSNVIDDKYLEVTQALDIEVLQD